MVVYSVLSTESDTQFVRVYPTYHPQDNDPKNNPDEKSVPDAQVNLVQGNNVYTLRPLTVERLDKSRYMSDIQAYFIYPLRVQGGKSYTLNVSSPSMGTATATANVPGKGSVSPELSGTLALSHPWSGLATDNIPISATLAPQAKAFVVRFFIDYLTDTPQGTVQKREEIPVNIRTISEFYAIYDFIYPTMVRRSTPTIQNPRFPQSDHYLFRTCAYTKSIELILLNGLNVRFQRAVFYLIQIDEPLYNYYRVVRAFQDPRTVRIDEQDYTNIKGGVGVFGSVSIDSSFWSLPERMYLPQNVPPTQCPN